MENFSLFEKEEKIECKTFIKWVGGKGQLIPEINKLYPVELGKTINKYAEIFIGGGAVLFDILSKYRLDEVYISDKNLELINTYKTIRDNVDILIKSLKEMEEQYVPMNNEDRKVYYYERRTENNNLKINIEENNIRKAVLFISGISCPLPPTHLINGLHSYFSSFSNKEKFSILNLSLVFVFI